MAAQALPCIVCEKVMRNVWEEVNNQPSEGVVAIISGNYGSTVFDPFDGTTLEIVVCDECLVEAGTKGRVLSGRPRRQVVLEGFVVGYEELDNPLVEWRQGLPGYDDQCVLYLEDFEPGADPLPNRIKIDPDALAAAHKLIKAGVQG